ncbi:MAG: TadE/TadG family type IV pilus assembly protein [Paracoccaceae bacterium]
MKIEAQFRSFGRDERGAVLMEFVTIFGPLIIFVLSICEILIAFHFSSAAQKSARLGARIASVEDPVHVGVPSRNVHNVSAGGVAGLACFQPYYGDICTDPGQVFTCDGKDLVRVGNTWSSNDPSCDAETFIRIINEVQKLNAYVTPDFVTVSYVYRQLGFADGPFVPEVVVELRRRQAPVQFLSVIGLLELRPVTASMIAEDILSRAETEADDEEPGASIDLTNPI